MIQITDAAQKVLEKRYYQPGEKTWYDLCDRVGCHFATNREEEKAFLNMLNEQLALPNSPTLMNAGTEITSYAACFVLPIEDDIESIFKYYSDAGRISKSGGGVGANFSAIRAAGSSVGTTGGVASGPISFMQGQDALTDVIKQGGKRRGANMGILDCDHADILDMVRAKDTPGVLENFNLSVGITDAFMKAVLGVTASGKAEGVLWDEIMKRVWSSGEPGVVFLDALERGNKLKHLGTLDATNPCGEQPLFPYESCSLISINLSHHVFDCTDDTSGECHVDWDRLRDTVQTSTLFMNRVLDKSVYAIPECQIAMELTRKIGVGIMGLHDMLIQLGLEYDSAAGRKMASDVMQFISDNANDFSFELGKREGYYDAYSRKGGTPRRRNACLTTIAPTGTLSMLADCSGGCEPYFATDTQKDVVVGSFTMKNKWGDFKSAEEIHWKDHVKMQACLQEHVDSSISKTINMPESATVEDIKKAYELAWKLGCKGITVYRDKSREVQVLSNQSKGVADDKGRGSGSGECSGEDGSTESVRPDLSGTERVRGDAPEGPIEAVNQIKEVSAQPTPYKLILPDELPSVRYRIRDNNGDKVYVNVCNFDGDPVEMFIKHPLEVPNGYLNTISRLVTVCLRYNIPIDDVTKALRKGSASVADTPAKLARILDKYKPESSPAVSMAARKVTKFEEAMKDWESIPDPDPEVDWGLTMDPAAKVDDDVLERLLELSQGDNLCPECITTLTHQGGCIHCQNCGYEECG